MAETMPRPTVREPVLTVTALCSLYEKFAYTAVYATNTSEVHGASFFHRRYFSNLQQRQRSRTRHQSAAAGENRRTSREKHQGSYRHAGLATDSGDELLF